MRTHLSMRLTMPSLQLTTKTSRNVAVRGRVALLVVLLRHGEGHAANSDQTSLCQCANKSGFTVRIPTTNLAQASSSNKDTSTPVSAVPIADRSGTTVIIGRADVPVARLAFHRVGFVFNHVVLGQLEKKAREID